MTLEFLQFIRDNYIHLQGHQYQLIQVIKKTQSMTLLTSNVLTNHTYRKAQTVCFLSIVPRLLNYRMYSKSPFDFCNYLRPVFP